VGTLPQQAHLLRWECHSLKHVWRIRSTIATRSRAPTAALRTRQGLVHEVKAQKPTTKASLRLSPDDIVFRPKRPGPVVDTSLSRSVEA
jgi:hypothetical protein